MEFELAHICLHARVQVKLKLSKLFLEMEVDAVCQKCNLHMFCHSFEFMTIQPPSLFATVIAILCNLDDHIEDAKAMTHQQLHSSMQIYVMSPN